MPTSLSLLRLALENLLAFSELGERSPEERRRRGVKDRPKGSKGSNRQALTQTDVLAKAPGYYARAARHKKAGIESPLLQRIRQRRLTPEELEMSEHAMLNEETGELEVSDEVSSLLDGMVAVLESAGYDIEEGMEAEEFVEQVGEVLETDEDLDAGKKQALLKSYQAVTQVIEAVRAEVAEGEEDEDDEKDEDEDGEDGEDGEDDSDEKDSDEKEKDTKKDDDKGDKKPFFLKKKAKKDDDADDAEEAVEGADGDEQEEQTITGHVLKHAQVQERP